MAEKTALPPVNCVSNSPERDWTNFQDAMRHILTVPKDDLRDKEEQGKEELTASSVPEK